MSSVIYRAEVKEDSQSTTTYTGLTCNTFKRRFYTHRQSFNKRTLEHSTTLSSHIWNMKGKKMKMKVNWSIVDRAREFNPVNRKRRLCLKEKYYIIFQPEGAKLNESSELFSTQKKKLLANT